MGEASREATQTVLGGSFVPESLQMRYNQGEKSEAREEAANINPVTDPFDIPEQPCAPSVTRRGQEPALGVSSLEIMHPSREPSAYRDSFHVDVYSATLE